MTRRRWILAAGAAVVVLLVIIGIIGGPGIVTAVIENEVDDRGLALSYDEREVEWDRVTLTNVEIAWTDLEGVEATLDRAVIEHELGAPRRIVVEEAELSLASMERIEALTKWAKENGAGIDVEVRSFEARIAGGKDPWVATGGPLKFSEGDLEIENLSISYGPWTLRDLKLLDAAENLSKLTLADDRGDAIMTLSFEPDGVLAALDEVRIKPLGRRLDWDIAVSDEATVSGEVALTEDGDAFEADLEIVGYVPPHPRELDAIAFGKKTTVKGRLVRKKKSFDVESLRVQAGALVLEGDEGELAFDGEHLQGRVVLKGSVPCADLAGSAISAHLGSTVGSLALGGARRHLGGSVFVTTTATFDTASGDDPALAIAAQVRCGVSLF